MDRVSWQHFQIHFHIHFIYIIYIYIYIYSLDIEERWGPDLRWWSCWHAEGMSHRCHPETLPVTKTQTNMRPRQQSTPRTGPKGPKRWGSHRATRCDVQLQNERWTNQPTPNQPTKPPSPSNPSIEAGNHLLLLLHVRLYVSLTLTPLEIIQSTLAAQEDGGCSLINVECFLQHIDVAQPPTNAGTQRDADGRYSMMNRRPIYTNASKRERKKMSIGNRNSSLPGQNTSWDLERKQTTTSKRISFWFRKNIKNVTFLIPLPTHNPITSFKKKWHLKRPF